MGTARAGAALVVLLATTSAGATTGPPALGRSLLTYAVDPWTLNGRRLPGGLCATDLRRLTVRISDPWVDGGPAWSPDGRSIAFSRSHDSRSDVFTEDAGGRNRRNLTRRAGGR